MIVIKLKWISIAILAAMLFFHCALNRNTIQRSTISYESFKELYDKHAPEPRHGHYNHSEISLVGERSCSAFLDSLKRDFPKSYRLIEIRKGEIQVDVPRLQIIAILDKYHIEFKLRIERAKFPDKRDETSIPKLNEYEATLKDQQETEKELTKLLAKEKNAIEKARLKVELSKTRREMEDILEYTKPNPGAEHTFRITYYDSAEYLTQQITIE